MTCIESKTKAALILEDFNSTSEEIIAAKQVLASQSCHSCNNPIVRDLSLDNLLCDKKE